MGPSEGQCYNFIGEHFAEDISTDGIPQNAPHISDAADWKIGKHFSLWALETFGLYKA